MAYMKRAQWHGIKYGNMAHTEPLRIQTSVTTKLPPSVKTQYDHAVIANNKTNNYVS